MPVNLYKGEASRNSEKKIGLAANLDENPGLWVLDDRGDNDGTQHFERGGRLASCDQYMCLFYQALIKQNNQ